MASRFSLLLPLAPWVLQRGSGLLTHWRRYIVLGFLSIFSYNSLQYLALHTSTAINVTLIAASMPVWMLVAGRLMYGQKMGKRDLIGAALSILGVAVVLAQGDLRNLSTFQFLPGDIYIVLATMGWAVYSWMLKHTTEPKQIRQDWAAMLLAQVFYGLIFSALFSAGEMWLSPENTVELVACWDPAFCVAWAGTSRIQDLGRRRRAGWSDAGWILRKSNATTRGSTLLTASRGVSQALSRHLIRTHCAGNLAECPRSEAVAKLTLGRTIPWRPSLHIRCCS